MSQRRAPPIEPTAALPSPASPVSCPSSSVQRFASLALIVHFSLLITALSANMAPSHLQGILLGWFSPYFIATNQDYGAVPISLTHADAIDFPLTIELLPTDSVTHEDSAWHKLEIPNSEENATGISFRASRWPNYARLVRLITVDQPDSEILADIATALVRFAEEQSRVSYRAIRLRATKVLSYDEDAALASNQGALLADELDSTLCYGANILRTSNHEIALVPFQERLRTAQPKQLPLSAEGTN